MSLSRRQFIHGAAALAGASAAGTSIAQSVVVDTARIVIGFPPGGLTDAIARRLADGLRAGNYARLAVVENKPGASGRFPLDEAARGPGDGTVLFTTPDVVLTQLPYTDPKTIPYKPDDFEAVSGVGRLHHGFAVGPLVPESVRSMKDFIAWAKANPSQATFGTPGFNSVQDFLMQIAMKEHGFEVKHVPYKGSAPGVQDLLGGQIAAMFSPVGDSLQHLPTRKLRLLATTGDRRSRFAPDVPTFEEQGLTGMVQTDWYGVWMKKGTPANVVGAAYTAVKATLARADTVEFLERFGVDVDPTPPEAIAATVREAHLKWAERIAKTGYKPA